MGKPNLTHIHFVHPVGIKLSAVVEQERQDALTSLQSVGTIHLKGDAVDNSYTLELEMKEGALICSFSSAVTPQDAPVEISLPLKTLRTTIRDYFLIVQSYEDAKGAGGARLEAIDMARRGIHNDGSEMLRGICARHFETDLDTARALFTLICVLHIGKVRGPKF
ncbi:MAG: UPF0262 family protein [Pseudobdellovibrionaceae bacterium]